MNLTLSAWGRACGAAAMVVALAIPAAAQTVTASDIDRLQDQVYQTSSDMSRMRDTGDTASRYQTELDDLREEVVYLKVKLRKEGSVNRRDYTDVRDRLQDLRSRVSGNDQRSNNTTGSNSSSRSSNSNGTGSNSSSGNSNSNGSWRTNSDPNGGSGSGNTRGGSSGASSGGISGGVSGDERTHSDQGNEGPTRGTNNSAIPSGQEIDVRLETELSSATAQVEQRFQATTVADMYRGNDVLIPAGSTMRGVISSVTKTTRTDRKGSLTVAFDQVTVRGRNYPLRGTVTQALESEGIKGEAAKIGAGAGVGAIIGGIIGGAKGALLGVLIGGGGTVAATEGKDVTLPAGTILRVSLDTPPAIR